MDNKYLVLLIALSIIAAFLIGHYVFPKVIETEKVVFQPIYYEEECPECPACPEPTVIEIVKEYKSLTNEDMKEYYEEVKAEYKPKTEIRPMNFIPYCDRKGVVC